MYVSCDLGDAYPAGVRRNFPLAIIVYDHFSYYTIHSEFESEAGSENGSTLLYAGIAAALMVVIVAAVLLVRRR